ncbi:hypothetical protein PF004_g16622 [Phytophthora fragariae]|uniref:Uncharacterized protein n=1 Tax=Phytophthora fragariae TaxID=53985 RepID=A0A6A3JNC1_9STRA|nr:hypothetical protein PF009_g18777 [Phytophthora fragariae]KAE8994928.1 hypothetical protein PF011_g16544 [Phytophthora fragariae]KAE9208939.1 hypothetical protein PF004_g16622 [Phytophthora fragariae]
MQIFIPSYKAIFKSLYKQYTRDRSWLQSSRFATRDNLRVPLHAIRRVAISKRQGAQRHALADRNCCSVRSADCNLLHPAHTQLEPAPLSAEEQKLQTLSSDGGLRAPLNILRQLRAFPHVPVFSGWVARLKHQHQQPRSFEM